MKKRVLSVWLVLSLCVSMLTPMGAFATAPEDAVGICSHHETHDAECGYIEEVEGQPCAHVHTSECGFFEDAEKLLCDLGCVDEDEDGVIDHGDDCAFTLITEAAENLRASEGPADFAAALDALCVRDCTDKDGDGVIDHAKDCAASLYARAEEKITCAHTHDVDCGYVEAVEGHPCEFVCDICGAEEIEETGETEETEGAEETEETEENEEYVVTDWSWPEDSWLMPASEYAWVEGVDWVFAYPGLEEDDLLTLLPSAIIAVLDTEEGTAVELPITWDFEGKEEYISGYYLIHAQLPDGYVLAEDAAELTVLVQMMAVSTLAAPVQGLSPEDLPGAMHFIVRHWHNEEPAGSIINAQEHNEDDSWYFFVAEGYIIPTESIPDKYKTPTLQGKKYQFYLVNQNYTENTEYSYVSTDDPNESWKLALLTEEDIGNSDYIKDIKWETGEIILKPNTENGESFAGYSISAGHGAATVNGESLTIKYDKYTHLVKSHAFYLDNNEKKTGTNDASVFGNNGFTKGNAEQDTAWANITNNDDGTKTYEQTAPGEGTKVYSTTEGLHTDKSVEAIEKEITNAKDETTKSTRQFNIELESWYTEGYAPQIGMALDASGSMIFAADTPTVIDVKSIIAKLENKKEDLNESQQEALTSLKAKLSMTVTGSNWDNIFLTDAELALILDPNNTDNSTLGSGGYSYFVLDKAGDYEPLGYWEGLPSPSAQLTFTNGGDLPKFPDSSNVERSWLYDNITGDHANRVDQVDLNNPYMFVETGITSWQNGDLKFSTGDGLQLKNSGNKAGVLLDAEPTGGNFTITFKLKPGATNTNQIGEILYIGPKSGNMNSGYFTLYRDAGSSANRMKGNQQPGGGNDVINVDGIFNNTTVKNITLVFKDAGTEGGTVSIYIDNVLKNSGKLEQNLDGYSIVLGGVKDNYDGNNDISIDDFTLYDFAADANVVPLLGSTSAPATARTWDGRVLGGFNGVDQTSAGWYLVSHGGDYKLFEEPGTAKRLYGIGVPANSNINSLTFNDGNSTYSPSGNTPGKFYVDEAGKLRCFVMAGNSAGDNNKNLLASYVYKLTDQEYIRTEAMQRAIGAFVTELNEASPTARLSAVRYSADTNTQNDRSDLVLLDWTSDPKESLGFLSLKRGGGSATGYDTSTNGINQYNYGLTGSTKTKEGLTAYKNHLQSNDQKPYGNAKDVPKYMIIFTDGDDSDGYTKAIALTGELKEDEYIIYVVVLANSGVTDYTQLARMAGKTGVTVNPETGKGEDNVQYLFTTKNDVGEGENIADELTELFVKGILDNIVQPLDDFNVTDYIDPRFDLVVTEETVDENGETIEKESVWKLGANGKVTGGRSAVLTKIEGIEVPLYECDHTLGKENPAANDPNPMLYYDNDKDMYYLEWTGQKIPTSEIGATELTVWSAKFTIQAKEDFIGGNAVLTNGNEANMNYVYSPYDLPNAAEDPDGPQDFEHNASSGTDDALRNTTASAKKYNPYPSKGFPRTAVDVTPPELDVEMDQTIFLGEELYSAKIAKELISKAQEAAEEDAREKDGISAQYYWEYLERFVKYFSVLDDERRSEVEELYTNGKENSGYVIMTGRMHDTILGDGAEADPDEFSVETLCKWMVEDHKDTQSTYHGLTIPYIYLPDQTGSNSTGTAAHREDVIGVLKFEVVEEVWEDTSVTKDYVYPEGPTTHTGTRISKLQVTYNSPNTSGRKPYNDMLVTEDEYRRDINYKPVAGVRVTEDIVISGALTTTIYNGEVQLQAVPSKRLANNNDALEKLAETETVISYVADLMRRFTDVDGKEKTEKVGELTVNDKVTKSNGKVITSPFTATFKPVEKGAMSKYPYSGYYDAVADSPETEDQFALPYGTYYLETQKYAEPPEGYAFQNIYVIPEGDDYSWENLFTTAKGYNEAGTYIAEINTGDNTATLGYAPTDDAGIEEDSGVAAIAEDEEADCVTRPYTDYRFGLFQVALDIVGDLKISKTVICDNDHQTAHNNDTFTFTVKLTVPDTLVEQDVKLSGSYSATLPGGEDGIVYVDENGYVYTEIKTVDGVTTKTPITLKHGESITIKDLPVGVKYDVEEEAKIGYIQVSPDANGASGEIKQKVLNNGTDTGLSEVAFINQAVHSLTVSKEVTGSKGEADKEWSFTVELTKPSYYDGNWKNYIQELVKDLNPGVTIVEPVPEGTDETDSVTLSFQLKSGDVIVIPDLPCGTGYTVTEQKNELGDKAYGTKVNDTRSVTASGKLNSDFIAKYVNSNPAGGIFLTKKVESPEAADESKAFTFVITLMDENQKGINGTFTCTGTGAPPSGEVTFTNGKVQVTLRPGETLHIEYPEEEVSNWTVTVTETNGTGFNTENTVTVTDHTGNSPSQKIKKTVTGTTSYLATIKDNEYSCDFAYENTRKTHDLTLAKTVTGNLGDREQEFEFTITMTDPTAGTPAPNLSGSYKIVDANGKPIKDADGKDVTFENGVATVKLKHSESIKIEGLPEDVQYTIVETGDNSSGYDTTYTVNNAQQTAGSKTVSGTIGNNDVSITCVNDRTGTIPTDSTNEYMWLVAIFLAAVMGLAWFLVKYLAGKRRRRT